MEEAKHKRSIYRTLTIKLIFNIEIVLSNDNSSVKDLDSLHGELLFKKFSIKVIRL